MIKFLLVALEFGLAHAQDTVSGPWETVAIAADRIDKIQEEGPLSIYTRSLQCNSAHKQLSLTFRVGLNGDCTVIIVQANYIGDDQFRVQYEGDNHFQVLNQTEDFLFIYEENVDHTSRRTKLIYVLGIGVNVLLRANAVTSILPKERLLIHSWNIIYCVDTETFWGQIVEAQKLQSYKDSDAFLEMNVVERRSHERADGQS
ncbi:odorant-binding protein 1a-like [Nannospalax galili]|uniref:odorant-binding protein 1a-like n=1 Tax=Nannospalax galili TaxID=1026970 RepID=UPI00081A0AE2|nr:odorant-binding protein 1a-like [Nannospalax galili]